MSFFNNEKLILGLCLGRENSQLCYMYTGDAEAKSLSYSGVPEEINIPMLLTKRERVNQWYYGADAERYSEENGTLLIDNIFEKAVCDEILQLEEREYSYRSMLALFVKRTLTAANSVGGVDNISHLAITCDDFSRETIDTIEVIKNSLRLKNTEVETYTYSEAFYSFMMKQPEELWKNASLLIREDGEKIVTYLLESNPNTKPVAVNIERKEYSFANMRAMLSEESSESLDNAFNYLLGDILGDIKIDSVYLCGEVFDEKWMNASLKTLCAGRRVFLGDNLFSKGAAYCINEKNYPTVLSEKYVYLGLDKVKVNIGIEVLNRGQNTYWALIDAGVSYFETDISFEFYLQYCEEVKFCITPIMAEEATEVFVKTPEIANDICRAECKISFTDVDSIVIEITDLGFGAIRPSTGKTWSEKIRINGSR